MLREALYLNGELYCDYRVQVYDCVDSEFFFAATVSLCAVRFACALGHFITLFTRMVLRKDTRMHEMNQALVALCIVTSIQFISSLIVLSNTSIIAREIFWSIVFPLGTCNAALYLNGLIEATPESLIENHRAKLPNAKLRMGVMFSFMFLMIAGQVILFGVIGAMEAGQIPANQLQNLFTAALALNAILLVLFMIVLTYYGITFLRVAEEIYKEIQHYCKISPNEYDHSALIMNVTINKIKRHIRIFIYAAIYVVFVCLLYAFYQGFFTNLIFSKVMICISNVGEALGIAIALVTLVAEVQRLRETAGNSSSQSFSGAGPEKELANQGSLKEIHLSFAK